MINKQNARIMLPLLVIIVFVICALLWYGSRLKEQLSVSTCSTLSEIVTQQTFNFYSTLEGERYTIKSIAGMMENMDGDMDEMVDMIAAVQPNTGFERLTICDQSGKGISSDRNAVDISGRSYFGRVLNGETIVSDPHSSSLRDEKIVAIATPIYKNGQVNNVLTGTYASKKLGGLFLSSFDGDGYAYVINQEGVIISSTGNNLSITDDQTIFNVLEHATFYEHDDYSAFRKNMKAGKDGHSKYEILGEKSSMHYQPLGLNGWYILSMVPETVIFAQAAKVSADANWMTSLIILVFLSFIFYTYQTQKKHIEQITTIAFVDELTGAPNGSKFSIDSTELLKQAAQPWAFIFLDVNQMKVFNDTFGFDHGDLLIQRIAQTLHDSTTKGEIYARLGSDEFCALLQYETQEIIEQRLQKLFGDIEREFKTHSEREYNLTFCAGVYIVTDFTEKINSISDKARYVHRNIRQHNANKIEFYDVSIKNKIARQKQIEDMMEQALEEEQFVVYLQPKYSTDTERLVGAESLVRWIKKDGSMIFPDEFISLFEKNGFIVRLDYYMFEKTCQLIQKWQVQGIHPVIISVNFSRVHLQNDAFVSDLHEIAMRYGVSPSWLEIELTETTMFDNEKIIAKVVGQLHALGFTISMDDFGSGYSSLGLLKNLPVDVIKLDRTFFDNNLDPVRAKTVIASVINMAKKLEIHTVAEGVETKLQIDLLRELHCDVVQGYYFAKPMPIEQFDKIIR